MSVIPWLLTVGHQNPQEHPLFILLYPGEVLNLSGLMDLKRTWMHTQHILICGWLAYRTFPGKLLHKPTNPKPVKQAFIFLNGIFHQLVIEYQKNMKRKEGSMKLTAKNMLLHFMTIMKHKKEVFILCYNADIPIRGILHDLSKFTPTEFFESALYFQGNSSPILACKKKNGVSYAWLHHRANNKHHPEYWVDSLADGGIPIRMPYRYNVEMICDIIAASKTYNAGTFHSGMPLSYFLGNKRLKKILHKKTWEFTYQALHHYSIHGDRHGLNKWYLKAKYEEIGNKKTGGNQVEKKQ